MNTEPVQRRFWAKVRQSAPEACWPWEGYTSPSGHGLTSHESLPIGAHRKAWVLTHGPIRGEQCVLHRCDNKLCCNPDHLYLGTRADNMIDRWRQTASEDRCARTYRTALTPEEIGQLFQDRMNGMKLTVCAEKYGVHVATICRYVSARRREKLAKLRADRLARLSQ